jgi:hypothetical protein
MRRLHDEELMLLISVLVLVLAFLVASIPAHDAPDLPTPSAIEASETGVSA